MMNDKDEARTMLQHSPGGEPLNVLADMLSHQASKKTLASRIASGNAPCRYKIADVACDRPALLRISGRLRWALDCLMDAGLTGCTAMTAPAPRWAAYVHRLRQMGLTIETVTERHQGAFPGTRARYILRSMVRRVSDE